MSVTDAIVSVPATPRAPNDFTALTVETSLYPRYLFYCYTCGQNAGDQQLGDERARQDNANENSDDNTNNGLAANSLPASYSWIIWRPQRGPALPQGLSGIKLQVRFLFRWLV